MNPLELAKLYFTLSNEKNLTEIGWLIHPDSIYDSENTGIHMGRENIMEMMTTFFDLFESIHWTIEDIASSDESVIILFYLQGTKKDGTTVEKKWKETIIVKDSLIYSIKVQNL